MGRRVVVGVDGSDASRRALEHAIEEARMRDATLEVVHAYQMPVYWGTVAYGTAPPAPDHEAIEREATQVLDRMLPHPPGDVRIERIVTRARAAEALLQVAEGADLLVVGSRGRGGFTGLLLGSTSHQVISHSPCPTVVVPAAPDHARSADAA